MNSHIKHFLLTGALVLLANFTPMAAVAQNALRTFTVINRSRYRIDHLYVSPTGYRYWGSDRLGTYVLYPNYRYDVSVYPGWYDVELVDQDGDACVLDNIDFRYGENWTVTDDLLVVCELFSAR